MSIGYRARWKNRQIPLTIGLLFMAGGPFSPLSQKSTTSVADYLDSTAVVMFMEANTYALMVVARILQCVPFSSLARKRPGLTIL